MVGPAGLRRAACACLAAGSCAVDAGSRAAILARAARVERGPARRLKIDSGGKTEISNSKSYIQKQSKQGTPREKRYNRRLIESEVVAKHHVVVPLFETNNLKLSRPASSDSRRDASPDSRQLVLSLLVLQILLVPDSSGFQAPGLRDVSTSENGFRFSRQLRLSARTDFDEVAVLVVLKRLLGLGPRVYSHLFTSTRSQPCSLVPWHAVLSPEYRTQTPLPLAISITTRKSQALALFIVASSPFRRRDPAYRKLGNVLRAPPRLQLLACIASLVPPTLTCAHIIVPSAPGPSGFLTFVVELQDCTRFLDAHKLPLALMHPDPKPRVRRRRESASDVARAAAAGPHRRVGNLHRAQSRSGSRCEYQLLAVENEVPVFVCKSSARISRRTDSQSENKEERGGCLGFYSRKRLEVGISGRVNGKLGFGGGNGLPLGLDVLVDRTVPTSMCLAVAPPFAAAHAPRAPNSRAALRQKSPCGPQCGSQNRQCTSHATVTFHLLGNTVVPPWWDHGVTKRVACNTSDSSRDHLSLLGVIHTGQQRRRAPKAEANASDADAEANECAAAFDFRLGLARVLPFKSTSASDTASPTAGAKATQYFTRLADAGDNFAETSCEEKRPPEPTRIAGMANLSTKFTVMGRLRTPFLLSVEYTLSEAVHVVGVANISGLFAKMEPGPHSTHPNRLN
ncbi:hypothetical protein B0H11DRAFT_1931273 [Mycena galericulata]|nr:hypothetical protein B0H11DRAFT_1931273 [Mycena galericulata]